MTSSDGAEARAIVIGASMTGLITARVLSRHFAQVEVIERDPAPTGPEPRKGVPQGRHSHVVLEAGAEILGRLFPGLWDEMLEAGTRATDLAEDWLWFHHGAWKQRQRIGLSMYCQTRPMLEWHVYRRLEAVEGVTLHHGRVVERLLHDDAASRVTGVELRARDSEPTTMRAALVVDASGRGTRTPRWLEQLGYGAVPETRVVSNIGYATRIVRLREDPSRDWQCMLIYPRPPQQTKVGYIFPIEGGRHMVTLAGYCGDHPPADEDGFRAFAREICRPEYYAELEHAEPLSPIRTYRLPSNLRRDYRRMARFPEGLAVLGDALCCFNPLFGQGMTTAAFGADALDRCLSRGADRPLAERLGGLAPRLWREVAPKNDLAWLLATSEDMRFPQVEGRRPVGLGILHWYVANLARMAAVDRDVHRRVLEVLAFRQGLPRLLSPKVVAKVLRFALRPAARDTLLERPYRTPLPSVDAAE